MALPAVRDQHRRILRQSETLQGGARDAFVTAVGAYRDRVSIRRLTDAIADADLGAANQEVDLQEFSAEIGGINEKVLDGVRAGKDLAKDATPLIPGTIFQFDLTSPQIINFVRNSTATLVTRVTEGTRQAIQQSILDAVNQGLPPRTAALALRDEIGLTLPQQKAVSRFRQSLVNEGVAPSVIDKRVKRLTKRKINQRSQTIARTELLTAVNEGTLAFWDQAVNSGAINQNEFEKMWLTARDSEVDCAICEPMEGVRVGVTELFTLPDGRVVRVPTEAHPNCRCTPTLVPVV